MSKRQIQALGSALFRQLGSGGAASALPRCSHALSEQTSILARVRQLALTSSSRPSTNSMPGYFTSASTLWLRRGFAAQPDPADQSSQEPKASTSQELPTHDVTYLGPLSKTHKLLKRISISNTLLAFAAAPAIVVWADNISMVSRTGLAISLTLFGVLTTAALHWITHPYVHELRYDAGSREVRVRTTTLLGRERWASFSLEDVQPLPWNRPVATFTAKGQFYYIDVYSFPDPGLLARLTPPDDSVPPGYKDDKDDD